jgi:hypothetical protein
MMQNPKFSVPYDPTIPIFYPPVFPRNENPQICTPPKARKALKILHFRYIIHQITATFFFKCIVDHVSIDTSIAVPKWLYIL